MNKKNKLFGPYLPIFAILTVLATVLRCIACFIHYDPESYRFSSKALIAASDYAVIVGVLIFLTYTRRASGNKKFIPDFSSPATYIPTGAVSLALLFFAKLSFDVGKSNFNIYENVPPNVNGSPYLTITLISYAVAILSLFSVAHFILTALNERPSSKLRASLAMSTVLTFGLYSIYLYFNSSMPVNAPNKIVDQMAFLSAAVFFLYETRLSLGREKWRPYLAFGLIASMLTCYSSVPSLIYYIVRSEVLSVSVYETVLTFTLFIFIVSRTILVGELIEDKTSPIVNTLSALAEKRSNELSEKEAELLRARLMAEEEAQAENADQISIYDIGENIYSEDSDTSYGADAQNTENGDTDE